jgi:hypothetical protein
MPTVAGNTLNIHGRLLGLARGLMESGDAWLSGAKMHGMLSGTMNGQTALGTNQATAFLMTNPTTQFTVVASGTGVVFPPAVQGMELCVINDGAQTLTAYGSATTSDTIDGVATATGVSVSAARRSKFKAMTTASLAEGSQAAVIGLWVSLGMAKST